MKQKTLKGLTQEFGEMHKNTEVGMTYSFTGGKSKSGEEVFESWLKEVGVKSISPNKREEIIGMFGNLQDFDFLNVYKILRGYQSAIIKICDIQGKAIMKEERPDKNFNEGEIVIMSEEATERYGITQGGSFGKILQLIGGDYVEILFYYFLMQILRS